MEGTYYPAQFTRIHWISMLSSELSNRAAQSWGCLRDKTSYEGVRPKAY